MSNQGVCFTSDRSTFTATAQSGIDTIQIPAVFTKEGVQNGGYKPREELRRATLWMEHRPIILNHPKIHGQPTTVRDLIHVIGYTSDITFDEEKAAITGTCNIWTGALSSSLVQGLLDGSVKEGSVGFWYRPEVRKGVWNGEEYREVQRDLLFDHYAILVDGEGACNHAEGCGLRMNREVTGEERMRGLIERITRKLKGGARLNRDITLHPGGEATPKDQPSDDSLAVDSEKSNLEAEKRELQKKLDALKRTEDERRLKEREKLLADITSRTGDSCDLYSSWTIDQLRVLDDVLRRNVDRTVKGIPSKGGERSGLTVGRWDPQKKEWTT